MFFSLRSGFVFVFLAVFMGLNSCDDVSSPDHHNEMELITTVKITYTDTLDPSITTSAQFQDLDGEGGNPPKLPDTIFLDSGRTYHVSVEFLDESNMEDVENITEEIEHEGDEHQIFYTSEKNLVNVTYTDKDQNNLPIGISTMQRTVSTGSGNLTITLKHQPGIKSETSTISDGETDVAVDFPLVVR